MVTVLPRALRRAALALSLALVPACKAGRGDACRCATDCKSGLQCAASGRRALQLGDCSAPGEGTNCCYGPAVYGVCVDAVDDQGSYDTVDPTAASEPLNKRDFALPSDGSESGSSGTASTSGSSTTDASTSSTTDASTSSTTDASTSSTTDASTSSTTDGTTGTTDPTTGTTGTT